MCLFRKTYLTASRLTHSRSGSVVDASGAGAMLGSGSAISVNGAARILARAVALRRRAVVQRKTVAAPSVASNLADDLDR